MKRQSRIKQMTRRSVLKGGASAAVLTSAIGIAPKFLISPARAQSGLAAGMTTALRALRPEARVTCVEPQGAATLAAALAAGHPVRLEQTASVADGLLPLSVGTITFNHLKGHVEAVTVSDTAIAEATFWLYSEQDVVAEPSGAATTAALRSGALRLTGPTVLVVSGGNVDVATITALASP